MSKIISLDCARVEANLGRYLSGNMEEALFEIIADHSMDCPKCAKLINEGFERELDTLLGNGTYKDFSELYSGGKNFHPIRRVK